MGHSRQCCCGLERTAFLMDVIIFTDGDQTQPLILGTGVFVLGRLGQHIFTALCQFCQHRPSETGLKNG